MGGQGAKTVLIEAQQAARPRLCEINIVIYPDHPFSIGCLSDMILKAVFCIINEPPLNLHQYYNLILAFSVTCVGYF